MKKEDKNFKIKDPKTNHLIDGEMMKKLRKILKTGEIHLISLNKQILMKIKVKIKISKAEDKKNKNKMKVRIIEF